MRLYISAAASVLVAGFLLSLVLVVGTPSLVSAQGSQGCNEWAGYHWHSFGCHAHPDDPHPPAAKPSMTSMADESMAMASTAPMADASGCNEWAGYHEHSFGCHAHPGTPHPPAAEPAMAGEAMATETMVMAPMAPTVPAYGPKGCNEWAGYHWHSFGCHAHPDDPHPTTAEPAMAAMASSAPMADASECNEWAGYHKHSFGCHAHPDDPHPPAAEPAMAEPGMASMTDKSMAMADEPAMAGESMATETMVMAPMAPPAPVYGLEGCNEWAGYHWHSFGCHAHPDDPHPTTAMDTMASMDGSMAMAMASPAPMASSTGCNAWASYHEHSFGCHAHPGTPHTSAE